MKYHDFHINKYEVSDRGETIIFHLVYGYECEETDTSVITFSNVAIYNIIHTNNAIITDIYEANISELIQENSQEFNEWNRMHSIKHWDKDMESYINTLQTNSYKAWHIESAIGFYGFIIAKEINNA